MKKVLYGVFMAFFAVMTMGALQSCTDDLTDLGGELNQTKYNLDELKNRVDNLEPRVGSLEASMQDVLQTKIPALQSAIQNNTNEIDGLKTQVKTLGEALNLRCDSLDTRLTAAEADLASMKAWMDVYGKWVETVKNDSVLEKMQASIDDLTPKVNQLYDEVFGENGLKDQVADLNSQVTELKAQFDQLQKQVDVLTNRINELITSLLIQATDSPVFGDFSLPLGVQTNILFNYYFYNQGQEFNFPTASAGQAYNGLKVEGVDFSTTEKVPEGYADVNLGDLYLTINPVGHNVIAGKSFSLETSNGTRLPFGLTVLPSDKELMFGYHNSSVTRSESNGFYAASVVIPADSVAAIEAADVHVSDDLKSAVKAILQDRTKRTALNLVKAVWDQVNGTFPRYAVRADWSVNDSAGVAQPYSVLSKYDLGVATTQPLSFAFYADGGAITSRQVPTFDHQFANLWNRVKNSGVLNIKDQLKIGNFTIGEVNVSIPENTEFINKLELEVKVNVGTDAKPDWKYGTATLDGTDKSDLNKNIAKAINDALKEAVGEKLVGNVDSAVNSYVENILSTVQGKIDSFVDKAESKTQVWFERLDKLVDLYNRAAEKINAFLAHPNDYLQPCVFYKADGQLGLVSADATNPTKFVNAGGEGFDLFPSTYTAELVAPCYKKYIACVEVDGKADGAAAVNSSADDLGKVLAGSTYKIFVPTAAMQAGKTYKFVYQALDYYGKTSTRFFYITL